MTNTVEEVATNAVAAVAQTATEAKEILTGTMGQQVEQGKELLQQVVTWLTHDGVALGVNVLSAILILVLGSFVARFVTATVRKALQKTKRVDELLVTFLCSVVSKTCWAVLWILALGRVGVDVGPLVAGLGVTGVVLGFAFKESLGSLAAGLMIALNHPFKVGDYVIAGGAEGSVLELNMMATVIATADNKRVTVPNSSVWGGAITNFSALGKRRVDLTVGVAYGTDVAKAIELAMKTLEKIPGVLRDPAPSVSFGSLDDSEITLNVRPWANCADYWAVFSAAQQAVTDAFEKAGIQIPFPQLEVHMDK